MIRRFFFSMWMGLAVIAGLFGGLVTPTPVSAQIQTGLQQVGGTINLPSTDPRVVATNIINASLGLLAIIMVVLIMYAGFLYMTSGGAAEKTAQAKKIITNSIIGLVLILSAWAITRFVIDRLLSASQSEGGGAVTTSGSGGGLGGGFAGGGGADPFRAKSIQPAGSVSVRNIEVKIIFNKAVDPGSAGGITVIKSGGAAVPGTVDISGSVATFTPSAACPAPNADRKCFDANTDFIVKVAGTVHSVAGQTISCAGFGAVCDGAFRSGSVVDTQPPVVTYAFPTEGMSLQANALSRLVANASDDAGVTTVEFFDGSTSLFVDAPTASSTPTSFVAHADWMTTGASLGSHTLAVIAKDVDSNTSARGSVNVVVRAEHCFNGKMDAPNETGIDCGGDPSSPEYCGSCAGGSCTKNADCASGFCSAGKCVVQPVVSAVSPLDGKPGTYVTIKGTNFGFSKGTVTFLGAAGTGDDKVASAPAACETAGVNTWSNDQVTIEVPAGATSGPIQIKNADSGLTDQTNDANGPAIPDFVVNSKEYPGLCGLTPSASTVSSYVDAIGQGFGSAGKVIFKTASKTAEASVDSWSGGRVHLRVPIVDIGTQSVTIQTATQSSNAVDFDVQEKIVSAPPQLAGIDPGEGPPQQYVTLTGSNFGYSTGKVVFSATDGSGYEAIGDTSFPSSCADGFWRDDRVVVKVPLTFTSKGTITDGKYNVKIVRADGTATDALPFTINSTLKLTPGICAIVPSIGPKGTIVKLFGDQFGTSPFVTFYLGKASAVDSATSQEVDTSVPDGAITGPVQLKADGVLSNKVNFQVRNCNESPDICQAGKEQCCASGECRPLTDSCGVKALTAEYAWQTSTGEIPIAPRVIEECGATTSTTSVLTPSPSPWSGRAGGDAVAKDVSVFMRFSRVIAAESLRLGNFRLMKCTNTTSTSDPCTSEERVDYALKTGLEAGGEQTLVELRPGTDFATSTTYEVKVLSSVHAAGVDASPMDVMKSCGTGPGGETYGYCFRFKTRATSDASKIGSILVAPGLFTMHAGGETAPYKAEPLDSTDACVVLNCARFDWQWYTGTASAKGSDGRALIKDAAGAGVCDNVVTGVAETSSVPVNINAEVTGSGVAGVGKLFVNFVPPHVTSYFPNCQQACSNVLLWAEFSNELNATRATDIRNIEIRPCKSSNCNEDEMGPALVLDPSAAKLLADANGNPGRRLTVSQKAGGKDQLLPGTFYRVLLVSAPDIAESMTGSNGLPLDGRNHPRGFQWTFRVKPDKDATCVADRIDVSPKEKYETNVGASQVFQATAYGKPDECSADGQTLDISTPAEWSSADTKVADLYTIAGKLIDTGAKLPPGCTGSCLATGATAVYGKTAVCGNGVIETTDTTWCKKLGLPLSQCRTMPAGAAAGEECEPSIQGASCDPATCLFLPVKKVTDGGTCGDGVVNAAIGEACDYGLRCTGASTTSTIADGTPCMTATAKSACAAAGGTCGVIQYRGCSVNCRHLGSSHAVGSVCGNGSTDDGEDCDYGTTSGNNGCSKDCLHEASITSDLVAAQCGNGILEPGEVCEAPILKDGSIGPFPPGCDSKTCLHTGTKACSSITDASCCGNGKIEPGEDCDGGDGCSASCLFLGASTKYTDAMGKLDPSFCGNGVLERGEQCDAGAPSNKVAAAIGYLDSTATPPPSPSIAAAMSVFATPIPSTRTSDPKQLAFIVGTAVPDSSGVMSTEISVALAGQTGKATYGLQCGLKDEKACKAGFGLDDNGCCRERPVVLTQYPAPGQTDVCRNVLVQATFNVPMDQASAAANFQISEMTPTPTSPCPAGTTSTLVEATYGPGLREWFHKMWDRLVSVFTGHPTYAAQWCVGNVTGQLLPLDSTTSTKTFALQLDHALSKYTTYRVRFIGDTSTSGDPLSDNADRSKRWGVKTSFGVVHANDTMDKGDLTWTFVTGPKICNVNVISISDVTAEAKGTEHPYLFMNAGGKPETRAFSAAAQYVQSGIAIPLSTTAEYAWNWQSWSSSNVNIVDHPRTKTGGVPTFATATSKNQNGNAILSVGIEVSADTVSVPPTTSSTVRGVAPVSVLACQHPWPTNASPFRDASDTTNFKVGDPFAGGPFYNFSTMYCRDAQDPNATSTSVLLPELTINQVQSTALDAVQGILRQYLFSYPTDDRIPSRYQGIGLQQDGIGIRILSNPQHLSPEAWYASRGFTGTPTATTVDGYPAVKDGTTVYVAATNRPIGGGKIYSNIYLISYNQGASPVTIGIYEQMLKYLAFNVNKEFTDQSNVCVTAAGGTFTNPAINGGDPVSCVADYECLAYASYDATLHCDSTKWKLVRDSLRLLDFQTITTSLESKKDGQGKYPQLLAGTYLQNQTNSLWSSWGKELGGLPTDPVNRFVTCGQCSATHAPCQATSDCPGKQECVGGSYKVDIKTGKSAWVTDTNIDPASCWNQTAHAYICPNIPDAGMYGRSRLYTYRAYNGGLRYQLGAEFEVPPDVDSTGKTVTSNWWSPPLAQAMYKCNKDVPGAGGKFCMKADGSGGDDKLCRPCPNGVCNKCQSGAHAGDFCQTSSDCGTGVVCSGDDKVPTVAGSCQLVGGSLAFRDVCTNVLVGDSGRCGDGILNTLGGEVCESSSVQSVPCTLPDGTKGHKQQICDLSTCKSWIDDPAHSACIADAVCGNGRIDAGEKCDDGTLNGKYGHCNARCDGFGGYCGDGLISPGELCDNGSANGAYGGSCGFDCKTKGPYCGDAAVNGPEQCDGTTETSKSALCTTGKVGTLCSIDADCDNSTTKGVCGGTAASNACTTDPATGRDTQRVRKCNAPGAKDSSGASIECTWPSWSACTPIGTCGDGIVDASEECDNGASNSDTAACTKSCKKNVCGDGHPLTGVEECDNGPDNGKATCSAAYGSSCLSCTVSCKWTASAGGYCGDNVKNGPEQCDGKDGLAGGVTCQSLGYDYGTVPVIPQLGREPGTGDVYALPTSPYGMCLFNSVYSDGTPEGLKKLTAFVDKASSFGGCQWDGDCNAGETLQWSTSGICVSQTPSCSAGCGYSGCARCSDGPTDPSLARKIAGTVHDAVYSNQPVPNARVTLMFKGVKVSDTFTDDNGAFSFNNLVGVKACNSYRIVVDFYGDNPKTPDYDESAAGGYWSFTSDAFTPDTFLSTVGDGTGLIFLLPRVPKTDTLVFVGWKGNLKTITGITYPDIDAHLVLPYMFNIGTAGEYTKGCLKYCHRDLNFRRPGNANLAKPPYAHVFCFHSDSPTEDCAGFDKAPEVMKYSHKLISTGIYNFYLSDWNMQWTNDTRDYVNPLDLSVSVVTADQVKVIAPAPFCDKSRGGAVLGVWRVFSQDAATGDVTEQNVFISKADASDPKGPYLLEDVGSSEVGSGGLMCVTLPTAPSSSTGSDGLAICASGTACCEKDPAFAYRAGVPGCFDSACKGTGVFKTCKAYCSATSGITTNCCDRTAGRDACLATF